MDVTNGADELSYTWTFSSNDQVEVIEEEDNRRRIVAAFNQVGTYQVRLLVEDSYGELVEIEKKVTVESTLRPELRIDPVVTQWGNPVTFTVATNKQVAYYEWDFGDGTVDREQSSTVQHTYNQAGIYPVTLTVVTSEDERNEITRQVFVGQQDQPTAAYEVRLGSNRTLIPNTTCTTSEGEEVAAYLVERYQQITLDASRSTNVQGARQ